MRKINSKYSLLLNSILLVGMMWGAQVCYGVGTDYNTEVTHVLISKIEANGLHISSADQNSIDKDVYNVSLSTEDDSIDVDIDPTFSLFKEDGNGNRVLVKVHDLRIKKMHVSHGHFLWKIIVAVNENESPTHYEINFFGNDRTVCKTMKGAMPELQMKLNNNPDGSKKIILKNISKHNIELTGVEKESNFNWGERYIGVDLQKFTSAIVSGAEIEVNLNPADSCSPDALKQVKFNSYFFPLDKSYNFKVGYKIEGVRVNSEQDSKHEIGIRIFRDCKISKALQEENKTKVVIKFILDNLGPDVFEDVLKGIGSNESLVSFILDNLGPDVFEDVRSFLF